MTLKKLPPPPAGLRWASSEVYSVEWTPAYYQASKDGPLIPTGHLVRLTSDGGLEVKAMPPFKRNHAARLLAPARLKKDGDPDDSIW